MWFSILSTLHTLQYGHDIGTILPVLLTYLIYTTLSIMYPTLWSMIDTISTLH